MKFVFTCFGAGLLIFAAQAKAADKDPYAELVAATGPLSPSEQHKKFRLPTGFVIELIAAEPDIKKPMNLNFDARGRLFVSDSLEYPFPAKPGVTPRDSIRVVEDTNRDGTFDRVSTFADGLNIPIGVVPVHQAVFGYGIPNIYRFDDSNGDGKADGRRPAYQAIGFGDTHGMASSFTWWIDGWIYGCHGFANNSEVRGADGNSIKMHSGNTYRFRPDGSHIEHFTFGQVNPFGMCFDPLGNLYTADCHSRPVYLLLRGARYPHFGDAHDGLGFAPEMIEHSHGSTGIAGVVYYAADAFPKEYQGTLFIGNPVTGRINHDRLEPRGSWHKAIELPDFVLCDDPWFRPVDLKLGPDGALYVADFYNRIIGHYEVPLTHPGRDRHRGRIWRIRYAPTAASRATARPGPDIAAQDAVGLFELLGHPNLTVRTLATHELVERIGPFAAETVRGRMAANANTWQRAHGLWVLQRLGKLDAETLLKLASDDDRLVRVHALRAVAERDWGHGPADWRRLAIRRLTDDDAMVRRVAADALGRHASSTNVPALLHAWQTTAADDTHLLHTVRLALRDNLRTIGVAAVLAGVHRDRPDDLIRLADVCLGIHTADSAAFILQQLASKATGPERFEEFLQHAARHADGSSLPRVVQFSRTFENADESRQRSCIRALHRAFEAKGDKLPNDIIGWAVTLTRGMIQGDGEQQVRSGLELAREMRLAGVFDVVTKLCGRKSPFPGLRHAAIDAAVAADALQATSLLGGIAANIDEPLEMRRKAAEALGAINSSESRKILAMQLPTAPAALSLPIAHGLAMSREGATTLLQLATEGKVSRRLLQDWGLNLRLGSHGITDLDKTVKALLADLPPDDNRIAKSIAAHGEAFRKGKADARRGALVFEKQCGNCHQLANKGAKVGPQLDGVGIRGLDRLLEDVLDPNRIVDQAFQSSIVALKDGRVVTGLVLREEGESVILADNQGKEIRLATADVEKSRKTPLSPMPSDVAEKIGEPDLLCVIAFLLEQRQSPTASSP